VIIHQTVPVEKKKELGVYASMIQDMSISKLGCEEALKCKLII